MTHRPGHRSAVPHLRLSVAPTELLFVNGKLRKEVTTFLYGKGPVKIFSGFQSIAFSVEWVGERPLLSA